MTSYTDNFSKLTSTKFDYIVVGGGTAGLPLAVRLSELPNVTVVVLEAGENIVDDPTIQIPANCLKVPNQEKYDWLIKTAPQEHLDNRVLNVSRGKMLGGTSNMNYMGYDRASKAEYDAWDRLTDGKTKWNWDAIVSSFKSAERFDPSSSPEDPLPSFSRSDADISYLGMTKEESIGTNGPLKLCYNDVYSDVAESYVKAINSLGVPTIANPLGGEKCGIYNALRTVDYTQGTRISSLDAYLMQAEGRENLTVLTGAHVTKINLNSDDGHDLLASGVEFVIGKEHLRVEASKEVILCAGSILTPALLELSGIGDSARLRSLGIDTLVDLPGVGENLQDHTFAPVQFQLHPHIKTLDWLRNDPKFLKEQLKLYETAKRGWMTMLESIPAFFPFKQIVDESTYTSVISNLKNTIESQKAAGLLSPAQEAHFAIQVEWLERGDVPSAEIWFLSGGMIAPEPGESYLTFIAGNQHPFSRGTVHITSTDPMSPPSVDPKFLSTDFDMEAHIAVYRMAEKLADTEPLKGIIKARSTPSTVLDGQALQDYIRQTAWSGGHYFGTAMMARRGLGVVVSSDLKVHGTRNLRVADSSIIPLPLASHIQATVYMIAEKAAEIIKTASRE